jgi:multiple sugar transport system ATP-binding protein
MDEPLSNLDARLRLHMRGELKRFQRDLETTAIYVTHDQAEAMTLADRVAIMNNGVLQQVGPPREVYRNPANMFVAGFLGSPPMNFLSLQVRRDGDAMTLNGPSVNLPVPTEWRSQIAGKSGGNEVVVGVRPEHVRVSTTPVAGAIKGEVFVVEDLGSELMIDMRVDGQPMIARSTEVTEPAIGDPIWIAFEPDDTHVFDPNTERHLVARG